MQHNGPVIAAAAVSLAVVSTMAGAANAQGGKPVVIGMIAEQSGPLGFYGQETRRSAEIFVERWNKAGGIAGRPIKLIVRDSKSSVNEAVRHARDLVYSENVDIILHSISSAECVGVANVAKRAKKIVFSACANEDFTNKSGGKYVFRVPNITARTQGYAAADYIKANLAGKANRIYTIAHDFAFGRAVVKDFKIRMKEINPKVEFVGEAWPKLSEAAYQPYVTAMIDAKPDIVFYSWGFGIPFWQQSSSFALPKKFSLVSSYWGGSDELHVLPRKAIPEGALLGGLPWYAIQSKANDEFVAAFREKYKKPPFTAAYLVLLNLEALKAGAEKAKSSDPEKLIAAMEGLEYDSVLGRIKIRDFDHQGNTPLWTGVAGYDEKLKIGVLKDIKRLPTEPYLPTKDEVAAMRK